MAGVTFSQVSKIYDGNGLRAVDNLDLAIEDGEFMVLVGPSGCGKSTALRMIAGLEEVSEGELKIGERVVNDVPPGNRDIAMVFQNYALYPHMTVRQNMGFALEVARVDKKVIAERVENAAGILGLTEYLDRLPKALSGGQRQRVAMGRAIVRSPQVFLMDEPLSNLDAKLRVQMRSEIVQLQSSLNTTMVYVTHDQVEAMTMGHRVAVMRRGLLQQVAPPQELYQRPANLFVAAFIGSPAMNLVQAEVGEVDGGLTVSFGGHTLRVGDKALSAYPGLREKVGQEIVLGLRPESFEMAEDSDLPPDRHMSVEVDLAEAMGAEVHIHFGVDAEQITVEDAAAGPSDDEIEALPGSARAKMIARVDGIHVVTRGQSVALAVKTDRLHAFDLETGAPLR